MNFQQAIEQIVNNWELLKDKSNTGTRKTLYFRHHLLLPEHDKRIT